jgi:hypothetical protein
MSVLPSKPSSDPPPPAPPTPPAPVEWGEWAPEAIRNDDFKAVAKYKSVDELAKGYVSLSKEMGARVKIPAPDAPAEEQAKFYERLPESLRPAAKPEELDFELPAGADKKLSMEAIGELKKLAISEKVPAAAFKKILGTYLNKQLAAMETEEKARAATVDAWKAVNVKLFGAKLEEAQGFAQRGVQMLMKEGVVTETDAKLLEMTGLEESPLLLKVLSEYGRARADSRIPGSGGGSQESDTPETADQMEAKLQALMGSDKNYKKTGEMTTEMKTLLEKIANARYGSQAA